MIRKQQSLPIVISVALGDKPLWRCLAIGPIDPLPNLPSQWLWGTEIVLYSNFIKLEIYIQAEINIHSTKLYFIMKLTFLLFLKNLKLLCSMRLRNILLCFGNRTDLCVIQLNFYLGVPVLIEKSHVLIKLYPCSGYPTGPFLRSRNNQCTFKICQTLKYTGCCPAR